MMILKKIAAFPALLLSVLILPFETIGFVFRLFLTVTTRSYTYLCYFVAKYIMPVLIMCYFNNTYMIYYGEWKEFFLSFFTMLGFTLLCCCPVVLLFFFLSRTSRQDIRYSLKYECPCIFRYSVMLFGWSLYQLGIRPAWICYFRRIGWNKLPSDDNDYFC